MAIETTPARPPTKGEEESASSGVRFGFVYALFDEAGSLDEQLSEMRSRGGGSIRIDAVGPSGGPPAWLFRKMQETSKAFGQMKNTGRRLLAVDHMARHLMDDEAEAVRSFDMSRIQAAEHVAGNLATHTVVVATVAGIVLGGVLVAVVQLLLA